MLLLLGASRRAYEAQQFLRPGQWAHTPPVGLIGRQLTGRVLGIFGMGRIGQATARRARALGMVIHYTNPTPLPEDAAAGATIETQTAIGMLALDNIDAVLSGRPAPTLVTA